MNNFRSKLYRFMSGRYLRVDSIGVMILIIYGILCILNAFLRSAVISITVLVMIALMFYRMFSRNITMRLHENAVFIKFLSSVKIEFKLFYDRIKYRKTNRFIKCKSCKAIIKVPYKKGNHTLKCPKCGNTFKVEI